MQDSLAALCVQYIDDVRPRVVLFVVDTDQKVHSLIEVANAILMRERSQVALEAETGFELVNLDSFQLGVSGEEEEASMALRIVCRDERVHIYWDQSLFDWRECLDKLSTLLGEQPSRQSFQELAITDDEELLVIASTHFGW